MSSISIQIIVDNGRLIKELARGKGAKLDNYFLGKTHFVWLVVSSKR